jgi:hypothetical protein
MEEQQKMINAKKDEANKLLAERDQVVSETTDKINVLDINVDENFEIDDI